MLPVPTGTISGEKTGEHRPERPAHAVDRLHQRWTQWSGAPLRVTARRPRACQRRVRDAARTERKRSHIPLRPSASRRVLFTIGRERSRRAAGAISRRARTLRIATNLFFVFAKRFGTWLRKVMLRPDGLRLLFAFAAGVVFSTLALPWPRKGGLDHVLTSLFAARAVTGEDKI